MLSPSGMFRARVSLIFACLKMSATILAGTVTVQSAKIGDTPAIQGYNLGTFMPGANTPDWWRYSGVNSARMFLAPSNFATMSSNSVASLSTFLSARDALRANPLSSTYFNWTDLEDRFENRDIGGYRVNSTISTLAGLGVGMIMQITASESSLPIAASTEWRDKWRLWKHYYAMAFHLARRHDVVRYQIYNEPDHSNANGLTPENWLIRHQLATDAIRSAIADVNTLYGKNLSAILYAPSSAGADFDTTWEGYAFANRRTDFLGVTNPAFSLFDRYDYHNYDSLPATFGNRVTANRAAMAAAMPGQLPLPVTFSEVNVNTSGTLESTTETLDTPARFSRLGAVLVEVTASRLDEMWLFKFTQTASASNASGIVKNGTHYADNVNFPYNQGGATQAAEVYRLFNKGFGPGREVLASSSSSDLQSLEFLAGRDPATGRYFVFSANDSSSSADILVSLAAWNVPAGSSVLIEEVSATSRGAIAPSGLTTVSGGTITSRTQPAYSVWLYTIDPRPASPALIITASDDATVKDGSNKSVNYGGSSTVVVKNDALNANGRNVGLLKFPLPILYPPDLLLASLEIHASTLSSTDSVQAHVYGIDNTAWLQSSVTWASTPNLRQGVAVGNKIQNNVLTGAGANAFMQGQLVVTGPAFSERKLDVTSFVRSRLTSRAAGFLLTQDFRWDQNVSTGASGDSQSDGIQIVSQEGATGSAPGPRLRILRRLDTDGDGLSDIAETTVFGTNPALADTDGDGVGDGAEYFAGTNPLTSDIVANPDSATTAFETPVTIPVLANDTSQNSSSLTVTGITQPARGSVTINNNSTLTYTPAAGYAGPDSFSYTISNGSGASDTTNVSITVTPASVTIPVPVAIEATIESGAGADTDVNEAALGYVSAKYSGTGTKRKAYFQFDAGSLAVNPSGTATFTISFAENRQQRVQLWALNQAYPAFTAAATWNSALANDTAGNGMTSAATAIGATVLLAPGSAPYTPATFNIPNIGSYTFGGRITLVLAGADDTANNSGGVRYTRASASLAVPLVGNTPPTVSDITSRTINEDSATSVISFTIGDAQSPASDLVVTATSSNLVKVPLSGITLAGSGSTRTIQVTPAPNQSGQSAITVTVTDPGGLSASDSFIVTINPVNDAPSLTAIPAQFTDVNTGTSEVSFLVDDIDNAAATLILNAVSSNQNLVPDSGLIIGGNDITRTLSITPNAFQLGSATITVTVSDGLLAGTTAFAFSVTGTAQEIWTFSNFGSANINTGPGAALADPDGDGLVNFLEYAFAGNPSAPDASSRNPSLSIAAEGLKFTFRKGAPELLYTVEQSSSLAPAVWSTTNSTESANGDGTFSRIVPAIGANTFLRLKVSTP